MKGTPMVSSDLMLRAMVAPEEIDIRDYQVIPFKGRLKQLTGMTHTPFKMIHLHQDNRKINIQVHFIPEERKAYINRMVYEEYRSEIEAYFSSKEKEKPSDLGSNVNEENSVTGHSPQAFQNYSQESAAGKDQADNELCTEDNKSKKGQGLKDYLLSDFGDHEYKRKSIIDIYCYNRDYYVSLKRGKKVKSAAVAFFDWSCALLEEAQEIPTEAFRRLKYAEIVDEYLKNHYDNMPAGHLKAPKKKSTEKNASSKGETGSKKAESEKKQSRKKIIIAGNPDKTKNKQSGPLHCIKDFSVLIKTDEIRVQNKRVKGNSLRMPIYECPQCKCLYTSISEYKDLTRIRFKDNKYINLDTIQDSERYKQYLINPHPLEPGSKCFIYQSKRPEECRVCKSRNLKTRGIVTDNSKKYHSRYCDHCNIHYLRWDEYKKRNKEWTLLNPEEYQSIIEEQERLQEEQRRKQERLQEELRKKQEERNAEIKARRELQKQERERKKLEREKRKQEELLLRKRLAEKRRIERELSEQQMKNLQRQYDQEVKKHLSERIGSEREHDNKIRVKYFVVRRTVFKCMHEGHALKNIDGIIEIINDKGDVIQAKVPAGYCPSCDVFFIMESTYQRLKMRGTPICRISDEKTYMKSSINPNGMRLAQESVLMQYGYSVSQQEGLSGNRRCKILAILIDNDILTRTEIISYLDFFINQRKNNSKYEKAIVKWEMDREFVSEYRTGAYTKYGISGISRR